MQDSPMYVQGMQSQTTILRIKRKRTDEPLDALVIESKTRRKKSRGASGFFQFAETVEEEAFWEDPTLTKDLRTRISTLASGEVTANGEVPVERTERETKSAPEASPGRRYTIVKKGVERKQPAPPVVHTASELPVPADEDFTMYDAVPESNTSANNAIPIPDPEMDKFLPMLEEYLRMNDVPANISSTSTKRNEGSEYVWDVFYHRPAMSEWAAAANIATVTGLPPAGQYDSDSDSDSAGDEDDEDSNTEDFYRNDYPEGDPDESSEDDFIDSEEEYPDAPEDKEEDEREFNDFLNWRRHR